MSIASELTRLQNAKNAITSAITEKGVTVPTGTKLDGMAALIGQIEQGGGEVKLETWNGRVMSANTMPEVYYTDENGVGAYAFNGEWGIDIVVAKSTYIVAVNMDEQNHAPVFVNCELVWLPGTPMSGNYIYLVKITGDNFHIEG